MESYTCTEYINLANLNKILASKKFDEPTMVKLNRLKARVKKTGHHSLTFKRSEMRINKKAVGRLYPSHDAPSLQNMPREIRKALAYNHYSDLDIVNAHPTIFHQLFEKEGILCPRLKDYITDREACLANTGLTRVEAKDAFVALMYGGKPQMNHNEFMRMFYEEFNTNSNKLLALARYNQYLKQAELDKPTNPLGHRRYEYARTRLGAEGDITGYQCPPREWV